jgi:hypothetical protein
MTKTEKRDCAGPILFIDVDLSNVHAVSDFGFRYSDLSRDFVPFGNKTCYQNQ